MIFSASCLAREIILSASSSACNTSLTSFIALVKLSSKVGHSLGMQTSKANLLACHRSIPLDDPYQDILVKTSSTVGNARSTHYNDNNFFNLIVFLFSLFSNSQKGVFKGFGRLGVYF